MSVDDRAQVATWSASRAGRAIPRRREVGFVETPQRLGLRALLRAMAVLSATCLSPPIRLSHSPIRFQLTNVRVTSSKLLIASDAHRDPELLIEAWDLKSLAVWSRRHPTRCLRLGDLS